jgi:hypothetical protein
MRHELLLTLEPYEQFTANILVGSRKKRKVDIRVMFVSVSASNFDRQNTTGFGLVAVRGFFYRQDGELAALQKSGHVRMDKLPLRVRSEVVSFFYPLIPRGVLVNALGVPLDTLPRARREPRSGTAAPRTGGPGTPVPPDPLAARSGQVVSPPGGTS